MCEGVCVCVRGARRGANRSRAAFPSLHHSSESHACVDSVLLFISHKLARRGIQANHREERGWHLAALRSWRPCCRNRVHAAAVRGCQTSQRAPGCSTHSPGGTCVKGARIPSCMSQAPVCQTPSKLQSHQTESVSGAVLHARA